jgi:hypothetical protein
MTYYPLPLRAQIFDYQHGKRRIILSAPFSAVTSMGVVTAPAGMISDGGSIPRAAWSIVGHPLSEFLEECVIHDWACDNPELFTRLEADRILKELMWNRGFPLWKIVAFYLAVRIGSLKP